MNALADNVKFQFYNPRSLVQQTVGVITGRRNIHSLEKFKRTLPPELMSLIMSQLEENAQRSIPSVRLRDSDDLPLLSRRSLKLLLMELSAEDWSAALLPIIDARLNRHTRDWRQKYGINHYPLSLFPSSSPAPGRAPCCCSPLPRKVQELTGKMWTGAFPSKKSLRFKYFVHILPTTLAAADLSALSASELKQSALGTHKPFLSISVILRYCTFGNISSFCFERGTTLSLSSSHGCV